MKQWHHKTRKVLVKEEKKAVWQKKLTREQVKVIKALNEL